ncbi:MULTISPECIES: DUF7134 domain-containing protein [Brachybacterium]|uniref:DUF7134 domain-containing protein n=1 Tax=Brachybacterium TaxID=43668 RepID=UPI003FD29B85
MRTERDTRTGGASTDASVDGPARQKPSRWWLVDLVLVLGLLAYTMPFFAGYFPGRSLEGAGVAIVAVALCVPLLVRRRYPLASFTVIFVVASAHLALGLAPIPADLALVIGLYTVASRLPVRWSLPALILVVGWPLVAFVPRVRAGEADFDLLSLPVVLAAWIWTWGLLTRSRRQRAGEQARQREAYARVVAAEERNLIARELHDIVSHSLGTMVVMADGAAHQSSIEPRRAGEMMTRVGEAGRSAMVDMRRMLGVLRDGDDVARMPQPGLTDLDRLVEQTEATGVRVDVTMHGERPELPPGVDLAAYRIVQEALTNARKHGGLMLSEIQATITVHAEELELRIRDDGQGPRGADGKVPGHGLVGMRERVTAYGGSLHTGPRPGGGFEVRAVLPVGGGA